MSAQIIAFPMQASTEQQRWIPAPRQRMQARVGLGWARLGGIAFAVVSSWVLVIGAARLMATVLL